MPDTAPFPVQAGQLVKTGRRLRAGVGLAVYVIRRTGGGECLAVHARRRACGVILAVFSRLWASEVLAVHACVRTSGTGLAVHAGGGGLAVHDATAR